MNLKSMSYCSYHICDRRNDFSTILRAQRLFKQLLVNKYCKVEGKKLSFLCQIQERLRPADYMSLTEYLGDTYAALFNEEDWTAEKLFVLRTTFVYRRLLVHEIADF